MSWVITLDGGSGSGKSSLAIAMAMKMNATLLPSGILYRLLAHWHTSGIAIADMPITSLHDQLQIKSVNGELVASWGGDNIMANLMSDNISQAASVLAQNEQIRQVLLDIQRHWPNENGLIAEGRDMGSVIFPSASVKWFVSCDIHTRAKRRVQQLLVLGIHVKFENVVKEILVRDQRDQSRNIAPLQKPEGSICIDNILDLDDQVNEMVRVSKLHLGAIL